MRDTRYGATQELRPLRSMALALGSAVVLLLGCSDSDSADGVGPTGPSGSTGSIDSDAVADAGGGAADPAVGNPAGGTDADDGIGGASGTGGVATDTGTDSPGGVDGSLAGPLDPGVILPTPSGLSPSFDGNYLDLDTFPYASIRSGGPAKDGIPALTNPPSVDPSGTAYLQGDDVVLGVVINGEAKAYPHNIGWWHEIVNDQVGDQPISVTFCPLTGTGLVFDARGEDGGQFELGVSGLLFNTNLIMYDRRDGNTLYPQIAHKAVEGSRKGETLTLLPVVETTWDTWQKLHPDTRVVEVGTYSLARYASYPYGDYRTNDSYFLFTLDTPLGANSNQFTGQLRAKERVLGVRLDGETKAYPLAAMGARSLINDRVGGVDISVLWDQQSYLAVPYAREVNGRSLTFDVDLGAGFPFGMRDRETDTVWDANGLALEGELAGVQLTQIPAHSSMWFAWVTFWQNTDVWQ